jgi:shikimate dehydrogenase
MEIRGGTRVFALLGDPVAHSLSPTMHNAAFAALGLDAAYVPLRCEAAALESLMDSLARQGGGGNVTIPHKAAAAELLSLRTGYALPVCNTFWGEAGGLSGAETDSEGVLAALARLDAPGGSWCIVGTGGTARAALVAAQRAGVALAVRSRTPGRAAAFRASADGLGVPAAALEDCSVILNCTPLGMAEGDPLPLAPSEVPAARVALDLVYRRGETKWVAVMRKAGCRAGDGREALIEQGAAAFEKWFPRRAAPREVMRAAVTAALG